MSDETAPRVTEDTPNPESTEPEVDWRKRYEDLQPEFTRSRQTLSDREALLAHIEQNFPDMFADPDPDPDLDDGDEDEDDNNDVPLTRAEFEQWKRGQFEQWRGEIDNERGESRFEKDLARLVGERELTDEGREVVQALTVTGGNNAKALEAAVEKWFKLNPPADPDAEAEAKPAKKAPHVLTGGKTASSVKDFSEMSRDEIDQYMADRVRALGTQT